jgi:hypothetical protein
MVLASPGLLLISLDSVSEESCEEGSRAVCRKEHSGKSDKEVNFTLRGAAKRVWGGG